MAINVGRLPIMKDVLLGRLERREQLDGARGGPHGWLIHERFPGRAVSNCGDVVRRRSQEPS
jgi:hypothetical protein